MPVEYIKRGYRKAYENGELIYKVAVEAAPVVEEETSEVVETGDE